jgi:ribonuclease D
MINSFPSNIDVEAIANLPLTQFNGRIIVVDNLDSLHSSIKLLNGLNLLGFDTETKPSFRKGQTHKVAMLQLASHDTSFIFRLNKIGFCDALMKILSENSIQKVGLSLKDDFRELSKLRHFRPAGFVELQQYVENFGIADKSLKKLVALVLKFRISKSQQTSNWENEKLTDSQLVYAATDAWACLEIYKQLKEIEIQHGKISKHHIEAR